MRKPRERERVGKKRRQHSNLKNNTTQKSQYEKNEKEPFFKKVKDKPGVGVGSGVGSGEGTGVGSGVGTGVGSGVGRGVGSGVGKGVGTT